MLYCDKCKGKNKGRYRTFKVEEGPQKGEIVTWCYDCLGTSSSYGKSDHEMWEHISTPWWKIAGLPPKPQDVALEKRMKSKGMTYGDLRKLRNLKATHPSAVNDFLKTKQ